MNCLRVWGRLCCGYVSGLSFVCASVRFSASISRQLRPDEDFLHPCILGGSRDLPPPATAVKCSSFPGVCRGFGVRGRWPVLCFLPSHEIPGPSHHISGCACAAHHIPTHGTIQCTWAPPHGLSDPSSLGSPGSQPLCRVFSWPEGPELLVNRCPAGGGVRTKEP